MQRCSGEAVVRARLDILLESALAALPTGGTQRSACWQHDYAPASSHTLPAAHHRLPPPCLLLTSLPSSPTSLPAAHLCRRPMRSWPASASGLMAAGRWCWTWGPTSATLHCMQVRACLPACLLGCHAPMPAPHCDPCGPTILSCCATSQGLPCSAYLTAHSEMQPAARHATSPGGPRPELRLLRLSYTLHTSCPRHNPISSSSRRKPTAQPTSPPS